MRGQSLLLSSPEVEREGLQNSIDCKAASSLEAAEKYCATACSLSTFPAGVLNAKCTETFLLICGMHRRAQDDLKSVKHIMGQAIPRDSARSDGEAATCQPMITVRV